VVLRGVALAGVTALTGLMVFTPSAAADKVRDAQWYLGPMGITQAQTIATGAGIKVAVIGSGVDGTVQDLSGAVVAGKDFSGKGSANGETPINDDPHETEVASVLAGRGDGTNSGVIGSAPGASILSASVELGIEGSEVQITAAVQWAVAQGAKIINMSLSGYPITAAGRDAITSAEAHGVIIVAAAGDDTPTVDSPASLPGVVAVSGIDKNLKHDTCSAAGPQLAVVAPYATINCGTEKSSDPYSGLLTALPADGVSTYRGDSGTSLGAPIVTGILALIEQKYPTLDPINVINRMLKTTTPLGSGQPNNDYGYGLPNAEKALTATVAPVTSIPMGGSYPAPAAASSAPAPSTSSVSSSSSAPSSSEPSPASSSAVASSGGGGSNLGLIIGIIAAVVVIGGLIALVLVRRRGSRGGPGGPPPGAWSAPPGR
jgi:subtilisin family serine protease